MLTFEEWRHTYADVFETDDAARAAWTAASNKGYSAGAQDTRELLAAHSAGAQEPVAYTTADRLKRIAERDRCSTVWHASIRDEGDIPLYTHPQPMPQTDAARELLAERERCIKACESVRDRSCAPEHSWAVDDCIAEIERLDCAKGE